MRLASTQGKNSTFPTITTMLPSGTAGRDENGTYHNALGLESTENMRHVSVIWQKKCIPVSEFAADVKEQQKFKFDRLMGADSLRLSDDLRLSDGTSFTLNGLMTMPRNAMKQGFVEYLAKDLGDYGNVSESDATRAKSDLAHYLNLELGHLSAQRDATLSTRLAKKKAQLSESGIVPSLSKKLKAEIQDLETRLQESKKFTVRTRNDDDGNQVVRYVASERYGVINNDTVMDIISGALPGGWGDSLASHAWNDGDSMIGNVLLPDYIKTRTDSEYGIGISFKNSEIGRYRFEICPFLFRAICLNGCIWGRSNSVIGIDKKHLGEINLDEIRMQVQAAVKLALAEGEQVLELFDITKEITVENQTQLVASLAKEFKLTIPQGRAWLNAIGDEPGETVFHTIQGLTKASQSFTGDVRQTMEETAGLILAPSLTADIDAIASMWEKFSVRAESLTPEQVAVYATAR
jgi:hypothetical protein